MCKFNQNRISIGQFLRGSPCGTIRSSRLEGFQASGGFTQKSSDPFRSRFSPSQFPAQLSTQFRNQAASLQCQHPQAFFQGDFLDTLATLLIKFGVKPCSFQGTFTSEVTNSRTVETSITLRIPRGHDQGDIDPLLNTLFHSSKTYKPSSLVRRFLLRFRLKILRDPRRWRHTQSSSFHSRSCLHRHTQGQLFSFSLQMLGVAQDRLCCWQLIQIKLLVDHVETICHLWGFPLKTSVHLVKAPSKTKPSGKVTWSSLAL